MFAVKADHFSKAEFSFQKKEKQFLTHFGQQDVVSYLSFVCFIKFPCFRFKEANCTA